MAHKPKHTTKAEPEKPATKQDAKPATVAVSAPVVTPAKPATVSVPNKETSSNMTSIIEYGEDISNAEAPKPLPANTYSGVIEACEAKLSAKGNEYVALSIRIPADQYPMDYTDGEPDGTLLSYNRVVIEKTARGRYRMKKLCEACGVRASSHVDLNDFVGQPVTVAVKNSEYEGEPRAEIDKILAA